MEDQLWETFAASGSITDYLQYAAQKGCNEFADSEGRRTDAEAGR